MFNVGDKVTVVATLKQLADFQIPAFDALVALGEVGTVTAVHTDCFDVQLDEHRNRPVWSYLPEHLELLRRGTELAGDWSDDPDEVDRRADDYQLGEALNF